MITRPTFGSINGNLIFFKLSFKDEVVRDSVAFLEKKEILLSFNKKAIRFAELLDPIMDELDAEELSY